MSSRIFRMWPALVLALLLAAVWYWGVPAEQAQAQGAPDVVVSPADLSVTEGSSGSYTVTLSAAPEARVVIQPEVVAGSPSGRVVTVAPSALVFTPADWRSKQRVRVSVSQNDVDELDTADAATVFHRLFSDGSDAGLHGSVSISIADDDDVAGVNLPATVSMAEGDSFAYLVSLSSDPGVGETVTVGLPDPIPGPVSYAGGPSSLAFTSANWRIPQAFVVKGVRDGVDGSNRVADFTHTVSASGTNGYDGLTLSPVRITVVDDDTRGVSFSPEGLVLAEGASATYTVRLNSKPSNGDVTVSLSAGGALAKAVKAGSDPETNQITFSANSWNSPQTVTVTAAAPDSSFTGVRSGTVTHSFSGGGYSGSETFSVQVFDSKRSTTSPLIISGGGPPFMTLNENGSGRASTYRVRLRNAPSGAVTVSLASSDTLVATVSPSTLAFDASSHGVEQLVTVTAEQDHAALRRDRFAQISHSLSGALSGSGGYVGVKVLDDDPAPSAPEVRFVAGEHCALSGTVPKCSEVPEGGVGKYGVQLSGLKPSGTVTLRVDSSNSSAVSVSPDVLHFTPSTWLVPQTVTVRSNGDGIVDDDVAGAVLTHRVSGGGYDAVSVPPVEVSVSSTLGGGDTGLVFSDAPILLSEGEGGSYGVRLKSKPAGVVTVFLAQPVKAGCGANGCDSHNPAVSTAAPQFSLDRSQMVFTPSNWDTAQIVRVTSFDDATVNGTRHFSIGYRVSSGSHGYLSGELGSVELRITDEDRDGVVISTTTMTLQPGATGTYTVRLASARPGDVFLVSEPGGSLGVFPSLLNFTPSDWSRDQVVTVTAPDDAGDFTISHAIGSKQVGYVFVRVVSGAGAGVVISPSSLSIDAGGFISYGVRLSAPPSGGNVVITAFVSDSTVATVSGPPLTFNESNWDDPQIVTVAGVSVGNAVIRHTAIGGGFASQFVGSVTVSVAPAPGVSFIKISKTRLDLVHGGSSGSNTGTYRVSLTSPPSSDVSVSVSPTLSGVVGVEPASFTLTSDNWENGRLVTVTSIGAGLAQVGHGSGNPVLEVQVTLGVSMPGWSMTAGRTRSAPDDGRDWGYFGDHVSYAYDKESPDSDRPLHDGRAWIYRLLFEEGDGDPPVSCAVDGGQFVRIHSRDIAGGEFVVNDGSGSSHVVSRTLFDEGINYVCLMDSMGFGRWHKPLQFRVVEPLDTYRVWLKSVDIQYDGLLGIHPTVNGAVLGRSGTHVTSGGDEVVVTFSEDLAATSVNASAFCLTVGDPSSCRGWKSGTAPKIIGNKLTLTLNSPVFVADNQYSNRIELDYNKPGTCTTNCLQDVGGDEVRGFENRRVLHLHATGGESVGNSTFTDLLDKSNFLVSRGKQSLNSIRNVSSTDYPLPGPRDDRRNGALPDAWHLPQYRGYALPADESVTQQDKYQYVTRTDGDLYHCQNVGVPRSTGGRLGGGQLGCEWDELPDGQSYLDPKKPWRVGLREATDAHAPIDVPGDEMTFRVACPRQSTQGECGPFAIFYGSVDVWRLTARDQDADFAIHREHVEDMVRHRVDDTLLRDGRTYFEFTIPRHSASNYDGKTFVSLVDCNQSVLAGFTSDEAENYKRALPDCTAPSVTGADFEVTSNPEGRYRYLRAAWAQHDPLTGNVLSCDLDSLVTRTIVTTTERVQVGEGDGASLEVRTTSATTYQWEHFVICNNRSDARPTFDQVHSCDDTLRLMPGLHGPPIGPTWRQLSDETTGGEDTDQPGTTVRTQIHDFRKHHYDGPCGYGPPRPFKHATDDFTPSSDAGPWGTASYNAARSFYGFVVDWQDGYGGGLGDVDDPYLLTHRGCPDNCAGTSNLGVPDGTSRWNDANGRVREVPDGEDSYSLSMRVPPAASGWSSEQQSSGYRDLPMHFAVYVSGMPAEHDYEAEGNVETDWRRVWLGSWDYGDEHDLEHGRGASRRPLGIAFPLGAGLSGESYLPPNVGDMADASLDLLIQREYADRNGRVYVYVVPCLPWFATPPTEPEGLELCVNLSERRGLSGGSRVIKFVGAGKVGPYGLDDPSGDINGAANLRYSRRFVVQFGDLAPGAVDDRPVSVPRTGVVPPETGGCRVVRNDNGVWGESLIWKGPCDSDELVPVDVSFANGDADHNEQIFRVYATGGRSKGLDLALTRRASAVGMPPEQLARMGLLERVATIGSGNGSPSSVKVTPDMADASGEVWLLAYECLGTAEYPVCSSVAPVGKDGAGNDLPYAVFDLWQPPAFAVRVKYTAVSGIAHAALGPICQGADCEPRTPVLRSAGPDGEDVCRVDGYGGAGTVDDLTYWPDRIVSGGACSPEDDSPLLVTVPNSVTVEDGRPLAFYVTGGRGSSLDVVQVKRGPSGEPAGVAGLRRLHTRVAPGEEGSARIMVAPHMADDSGRVLILAYDCDGFLSRCPEPSAGSFDIMERPLFQVLVRYGPRNVPELSDLMVCEGDECRISYGVGRRAAPSVADSCQVDSFFNGSEHVWPLQLVAGGGCDRNDLDDVSVSFDSSGSHSLVVYATGGRSDGLGLVQVKTPAEGSSVTGGSSPSGALPHYSDPMDVPLNVVDGDFSGPGSAGAANVTDGGSLLRAHNTQNMRWVHSRHVDLYNAMSAKSWVQDGLIDLEKSALDYLLYIAVRESTTATVAKRVVVMPFLATLDSTDVLVLRGLNRATVGGFAARILDHSALTSGITDAQRVLVIGASTMSSRTPSDVGGLLSNGYAGGVVSSVSSGVQVTVARRTAASQSYVPTVIASAMRGVRVHMGSPFPVDHIVALGDSASVSPGAAGVNHGFAISYLPRYEVADSGHAADQLKSILIHEVAHYYWRGAQPWVNEGMASAFEVFLASDFNLPDSVVINEQGTCTLANLRALVRAAPSLGDDQFRCNYYLGQRLFVALHEAMGESAFMTGARALYAEIRDCRARGGDRCGDIDDVLAAFSSQRALVEQHWGGTLPPVTGGVASVVTSNDLGRLGLFENRLTVTANANGVVTLSPDQADADGNIYLLAYVCDGGHGGSGCPILGRPTLTGYALGTGPDFAVQVRFTERSGLEHSDVGTVCQGSNCSPPTPVLRAAAPDSEESCSARVRTAAADELTYWPDRVISGGACDPNSFEPITFTLENGTNYQRPVVVYSTGGTDFPHLQLRRSGVATFDDGTNRDAAGSPSGKQGLKRDVLTGAGGVTVNAAMADDDGLVWLLGYDCNGSSASCPLPVGASDPTVFNIESRPLFQVLTRFSDEPGIVIEPRDISLREGGSGEYMVRLTTKPRGNVTVTLSLNVLGALTIEPPTLVLEFTPDNWGDTQTVRVTSVNNDDVEDRTVVISHAVAGANYGGRVCGDGCPVTVSIEDDDAYGASISRTVLTIHEGTAAAPGFGEYTVVLNARPTGPVTMALTVDSAAGVITVPASLTFTPGDWDVPQTVRVTAVYDEEYHVPARTAGIAHSFSGGGYDSTVSVPAVNATVVDAQVPSVGITDPGGVVIPGNRLVMRVGETRDYELSLGSKPAQLVTMSLSAAPSGVVRVSPDSLTFSTANWSAAQVVTITADAVGEAVIDHQGSGEIYDRVRIPSIQVEVLPVSNPGAQLSPASPISLAKGAVGQYRLSLTQRPVGEVAVSVTSSGSAATVSPTSVVFNGSNWRRGHAFAVTAGDAVGSVTFTHDFSGGGYDGLADLDMTVNVVEPGSPGIIIGTSHDGDFVAPSGDDPAVQAWDVSVDVQRGWWDTLVSGVTHVVSYVESWWPFGHGSSHGSDGLDAVTAGHAGLKWAWVGNEITIHLTGFTSGNRVWAYLVVPDRGAGVPSSCVTTDVSTVFVAVGDVSSGGNSPVFKVPVSLDTFSLGENYVCAVDGTGRKLALPQTFVVHEPPDRYRMELTLNDVEVGSATGNLGDGFQVINGRHHGENPWKSPQIRGNSADAGDYRTKTNFSWWRCAGGPDNAVGGAQVGCEWLSDHDSAMVHEPWRVGMVAVPDGGAAAVAVPGDDVELRVKLGPTQFTGREVARFAVYWGPVDLWMLGSPSGPADDDGPTEARTYAIHRDHLSGLRQKLVAQRDVAPDGSYTFTVPRSSANDRGDTFVAIVPCNVDYIGFGDEELERNKRSLSDCDTPLNSRASFDSVVSEDQDDDPHTLLRAAWQQHDVLSGRGLVCDVTVVEETVDGRTVRKYDADCGNPARSTHSDFTDSAVRECDGYLRNPGTLPVEKTSGLLCGWGPVEPIGSVTTWASTDYNALRSVYGFVIDWQWGGALGVSDNDGCEVDLLKYRLDRSDARGANNDAAGVRIRRVSLLENGHPIGAKYWRVGKSLEKHCAAPPDADELDVTFYTPFADDEWSSERRDWHNNEPVHFALYVTGLPAEHDDRSAGGDGVSGGDGDSEWSRVALGSWDIRALGLANTGGSRRLLGYAMPLKDYEFGTRTVPNIEDFTDGVKFTVPREYADSNGRVRLYVVPCLPLYGPAPSVDAYHGPCYDVARSAPDHDANAGIARPAIFERASDSRGPFGLLTGSSDYLLRYSYEVVVTFDALPGVPWDGVVSVPTTTVTPDGDLCKVRSRPDGTWQTALVTGGPCEVGDDSALQVYFENESNGGNVLSVYGTGGRSSGLDLVKVNRASGELGEAADVLGRLGLLERIPVSMGASSSDTDVQSVTVTPDMADEAGNVWLMAYHCTGPTGTSGSAICPRSLRNASAGEVPAFNLRVTHSFMVRVKYTSIAHTDLGSICQGDDCEPVMPVLRTDGPSGNGECLVEGYSDTGVVDDLTYWPDRVVRGGGCAPAVDEPVTVTVPNPFHLGRRHLVFYATGGRDDALSDVQVRRGPDGSPAGAVGLQEVNSVAVAGDAASNKASVVVTPDLADANGRVLVLAYDCGTGADPDCPDLSGVSVFDVLERPLFQVLVEYDGLLVVPGGLSICKGDSCLTSYDVGRVAPPTGSGCSVSAYSDGARDRWPNRLVAGGACDVDSLDTVMVRLNGLSNLPLRFYLTGGRSPGLDGVQVGRTDGEGDGRVPFRGYRGESRRVVVPGPQIAAGAAPRLATLDLLGGKDWVADSLTAAESRFKRVFDNSSFSEAEARRVAAMPFLDAFDDTDRLVLLSLMASKFDGKLSVILNHPQMSDGGGIAEDERVLVVGAGVQHSSAAVRALLEGGGYGSPESLTLGTSRTPGLKVSVARDGTAARQGYTGRFVADAVRHAEQLMGVAIGVDHVMLFLDDNAFSPESIGVEGYNYQLVGTTPEFTADLGPYVIAYRPHLEQADGTDASSRLKSGIIHEVAHYYWWGSSAWIDEGIASAFEVLVGDAMGVPAELRQASECNFATIREWELVGSPDNACPYYLGQSLFLELHSELGRVAFLRGLRALQQSITECRGLDACGSAEQVRAAFAGAAASAIVDKWVGVGSTVISTDSSPLGRLGVRKVTPYPVEDYSIVTVHPDLADEQGNVYLLAYGCDSSAGCPEVHASNGYDLDVGPAFVVRVRFTPESGLAAADLKEVCRGQECDIAHPWLRRAEPDVGECGARLGTYWPDRVIRGGDCYIRGSNYGPVVFKSDAAEKFVVYTTGDVRRELDLVQVRGVLGDVGDDAANDSAEPLGRYGLRESLIDLAPGGEERAWVRADMADDDGNVWLFAYRCLTDHGDVGCPLVDRDQVRPSYDLPVRPTFVVRVSFVSGADADRSTLEAHCSTSTGTCELTATFRDADGMTLPGTVEFRVDRGALGEAGSTAQVSRKRHLKDATGNHQFKETLILPADGGMVNVEAEMLGDGTVLTKRVGHATNVARLSADVMRCSDDEKSCHAGGLTRAERLLAGDHFVLAVTGYDASGDVALPVTRLGEAECRAGRPGAWPMFQLNSEYLRSYGYGTSQPSDRGYAGCAIQVLENAPVGTHGITVSYRAGSGAPVTVRVQVVVGVDTSKLGYLLLSGPSQLESGKSGTYRVVGLNLERLRMGYDLNGGCLKLNLSGALEGGEGGSASSGCISDGLPKSGVEFTVQAKEDVVYQTDSSVGVSYGDIKVSNHVMVIPAEDDAGAPVPATSSHISNLTISQEGGQLSVTWNGSPQADFKSLRAQVWVVVGGEDVFLPGCEGGEVHAVDTQQVFCLLSYGRSEDVYHAAVGFIRYDNSAVPVETTQWTRP